MERRAEYSVWIWLSSTDQNRWNIRFFSYLNKVIMIICYSQVKLFRQFNFNSLWQSDDIQCHRSLPSFAPIMACCLMVPNHITWSKGDLLSRRPSGTNSVKFESKYNNFQFKNFTYLKISFANRPPFCSGLNVLMTKNRKVHKKANIFSILTKQWF